MPAGYIYLSLFAGMYGTVVPKLSEMKLCMPPFYSALVTNGWTRICCLRGERKNGDCRLLGCLHGE